MEIGMRVSWGKVLPGKTQEALTMFQDAVTFYGKRVADGKITYFEPFFTSTGELTVEAGFFLIKGPVTEIFKILEEEDYKDLNAKAYYLLDHFKVDLLTVGEEIEVQLKRFEKAGVAYEL